MKLAEAKHPLVKHKLGVMREADIDNVPVNSPLK